MRRQISPKLTLPLSFLVFPSILTRTPELRLSRAHWGEEALFHSQWGSHCSGFLSSVRKKHATHSSRETRSSQPREDEAGKSHREPPTAVPFGYPHAEPCAEYETWGHQDNTHCTPGSREKAGREFTNKNYCQHMGLLCNTVRGVIEINLVIFWNLTDFKFQKCLFSLIYSYQHFTHQ